MIIIPPPDRYVMQMYPRFLRKHFNLLRTVVNKNFQFMHEPHPGVQDMAVSTFRRLAEECGREMVAPQRVDGVVHDPFVNAIILGTPAFVEKLSLEQREVYFEGLAAVLNEQKDAAQRLVLLQNVLLPANQRWRELLGSEPALAAALTDPQALQEIRAVLRILTVFTRKMGNLLTYQVGMGAEAEDIYVGRMIPCT